MPLSKRLAAEFLGTLFLVATVVGSGVMADRLSEDIAVSLLGNTIPTGAILFVLITLFGPISGAHFNPVVTGVFCWRCEIAKKDAVLYIFAQILGGVLGTLLAHGMFDLPLLQTSSTMRSGGPQYLSEIVASFGLVMTILIALRSDASKIAMLVGLYITAAYWFTASTSFANPAVSIARALSDTFAGIRPLDVPMFVLSQCIGAALAAGLAAWIFADPKPPK